MTTFALRCIVGRLIAREQAGATIVSAGAQGYRRAALKTFSRHRIRTAIPCLWQTPLPPPKKIEMSYSDFLPFAAGLLVTGALSGVLAGLLGIGGGGIIVPALALALGTMGYGCDVGQHVAVATSLAIIIPIGISSARSHYEKGALDQPTLKLWAPVIFIATLAGGLSAGIFRGRCFRRC
jgi:hypothetical protein